jgi:hypothetical protein
LHPSLTTRCRSRSIVNWRSMKVSNAAMLALVVYLLVPPFKSGPDSLACAGGSSAACLRQTFNPKRSSANGGCYNLSILPRHARPSAITGYECLKNVRIAERIRSALRLPSSQGSTWI